MNQPQEPTPTPSTMRRARLVLACCAVGLGTVLVVAAPELGLTLPLVVRVGVVLVAFAALTGLVVRQLRAAQATAQALADSQARFRTAADQAPVLIWMAGDDQGGTWVNQQWLRFTGRTFEQEAGSGWMEGIHPDDLAECRRSFAEHFERQAAFSHEYRLRRHDGQWRWLLDTGTPRRDERGAFLGFIGSCVDITELKEAHARLEGATRTAREASELKSRFLANMSHEIRTPLNAILGLTELGLEEPSRAKLGEYLGLIHRSGHGLLGIVNDILDFSKIEAGRMTIEQVPFNLPTLIHEVVEPFQVTAEARGLTLRCAVAPGVPAHVVGDPLRVRQVLVNLVANAIKFTEAGGVEVDARSAGPGEVHVSVRDTGIGLTAEQESRLFQAFSQADSSSTRRFGGTGLGLAISRSLARAMGGELSVRSQPGAGSTFTLSLPLTEARPQESAAPPPRPAPSRPEVPPRLRGRRVLLAEDNKVNQLLARTLLEKAGLTVVVAHDGREAVELGTQPGPAFDAVLMDLQMPELDGYQATVALRERLGATCPPIIALTAHALPEEHARTRAAGMVAHVTKPLDVGRLYAALDEVVR